MSDSLDRGLTADTNLIGKIASPPQVNLLGAYNDASRTAEGIWKTREAQAQDAWGNALQQATDPKTGVVDYNRANALAAGNPQAAMGMMAGLKGSSQLTGATQDQGIKRNQMMTDMMASTLKLGDDQLHAGILANGRQLVSTGAITQAQFEEGLVGLPNDPKQLRQLIEQRRMALLPPQMQQPALYGAIGTQTTPGGENIGTRQSVQTGAVTPAQPGGTGVMSDTDWDKPFTYKDPNSNQTLVTTPREYFRAHNIPVPQIIAPGGGDGVPPTLRTNPKNQNRPTSSAPPPAQPGQPASGASGAAPDTTAKWEASTKQYNAANEEAGSYQRRIFPLAQSRALLESGDVTTGRGSEALQTLKSVLGTAAAQFGWDVNTINNAKYEELKKYQIDYINSNPFAGGSDQRLASAITGNPSSHISTLANKDVTKALIALERMKQAAISDFKTQGGQPRDWSDHLSALQNDLDPRAFLIDMVDQEKLDSSLKTKAERDRFKHTLDIIGRNPGIMGQAVVPH